MVRLVMCYGIGDGCTYSCDETIPFEYESAEAAIVDFEDLIKQNQHASEVQFAGHTFYPYHFFENGTFYGPSIYTVDEWFVAKGAQ